LRAAVSSPTTPFSRLRAVRKARHASFDGRFRCKPTRKCQNGELTRLHADRESLLPEVVIAFDSECQKRHLGYWRYYKQPPVTNNVSEERRTALSANVKSLFEAIYRRVALINTTQLCLLFCGAACIFAALQIQKRPYQRFVPFSGDNSTTAFDTKTGQACVTVPSSITSNTTADGKQIFPYCLDLYERSK
jgi:hypothetical protein